jgi:AcrR family transcriptional regulator
MQTETASSPLRRKRRRDPAVAERQAARRRGLLDAAMRAIRRTGPATTMDDICAEAGVSKPIIYRHFGDKAGLYRAVAERHLLSLMADLQVEADREPRQVLEAMVNAYLAHLERELAVHRFLEYCASREVPEVEATVHGLCAHVADRLADSVRTWLAASGGDPSYAEAWTHALVGAATSAGEWWLADRSVSRAWVSHALATLFWQGLGGVSAAADRVE